MLTVLERLVPSARPHLQRGLGLRQAPLPRVTVGCQLPLSRERGLRLAAQLPQPKLLRLHMALSLGQECLRTWLHGQQEQPNMGSPPDKTPALTCLLPSCFPQAHMRMATLQRVMTFAGLCSYSLILKS